MSAFLMTGRDSTLDASFNQLCTLNKLLLSNGSINPPLNPIDNTLPLQGLSDSPVLNLINL